MLIPVLHLEDSVQVLDLTRFRADKSVAVKGTVGAINSVKIKPAADLAFIEVFNTEPSEWFLDYVYTSQAFDVWSDNNALNFEVDGVKYRALVASGTYTLNTLLTAIKTSIETLVSSFTVTLSVDSFNRITITPSKSLRLLLNRELACLFSQLNFVDSESLKSLPVEYGLRKVTLEVATASESATIDKSIKVLTVESDKLFSSDADLVTREPDIMKWLPEGRASYLDQHRKTQVEVIDWLFRKGYYDDNGNKLTKWSIVHTDELRQWAIYKTLAGLMFSFSNQVDDVFMKKYEKYSGMAQAAKDIYSLTLDKNNDGEADVVQDKGTAEGTLIRR